MRVIFSTLAKQELEEAAQHYEFEKPGLGKRFKAEIKRSARVIARYPGAWSIERGEIRKCSLHRFPYKLLYSIEQDHVVIVAVAHQHRRPDYWGLFAFNLLWVTLILLQGIRRLHNAVVPSSSAQHTHSEPPKTMANVSRAALPPQALSVTEGTTELINSAESPISINPAKTTDSI